VYYLTCLKCAEWARLQQASLDAVARLAEDVAARDEQLTTLRTDADGHAAARAAAERRRDAVEQEHRRRTEEMLGILRAREARAGRANGKK